VYFCILRQEGTVAASDRTHMSTYLGTGVAGVCVNQLWGVNWHMHRHMGPADIGGAVDVCPQKVIALILPYYLFFMAALWNRTGHYIFVLWFLSFYLSFFLSSPNLSSRRSDVYHTSTHSENFTEI